MSQGLFVLGLLLGWLILYVTVLSGFPQHHAQHQLYQQLRTTLAEGTAPTGAPIAAGAPVALIDLPAIDAHDLVVTEGVDDLTRAPGHLPGSVLPGQAGVSVLMGKGLSYGAPFGGLSLLRPGDPITVTTAQGRFVYRVTGLRRAGQLAPPAPASGSGRLTLVTAAGTGWLAHLRPSEALYVDATVVGDAVTAGPIAAVGPARIPMSVHATAGELAELVLALQLLALVVAGTVWAWLRWSQIAAWVVGTPVVLSSAWIVSLVLGRMLPGLV